MEDYLEGSLTLSHEMLRFRDFLDVLRKYQAEPERKWAFNQDWVQVDFEDKENGMIRGILDAISLVDGVLEVYEWKTGRKYPDHAQQRILYGLAGLLMYPEVEKCLVTTLYIDTGEKPYTEMLRSSIGEYKWIWERKVNQCQPPQPYTMRPNWKCKFCEYSKRNGGKCPN